MKLPSDENIFSGQRTGPDAGPGSAFFWALWRGCTLKHMGSQHHPAVATQAAGCTFSGMRGERHLGGCLLLLQVPALHTFNYDQRSPTWQ
jgi:hypothetical protein